MKRWLTIIVLTLSMTLFKVNNVFALKYINLESALCQYSGTAFYKDGSGGGGTQCASRIDIRPTASNGTFEITTHMLGCASGDNADIASTNTINNKFSLGHYGNDIKTFDVKFSNAEVKSQLLNNGVCPPYIKAYQGTIGSDPYISGLVFGNTNESVTSASQYFETNFTFKDEVYGVRVNSSARFLFDHNASYKEYNFNSDACSSYLKDKNKAEYLNEVFTIINYYKSNAALLTMAKGNDIGSIAQDIYVKYAPNGRCREGASDELLEIYDHLYDKASQLKDLIGAAEDREREEDFKNKCQFILGDPSKEGYFAYYLDTTFRFIKFLAPALLIVFTIIDYIKVIAQSDNDGIKKVNKKTITRMIFTLLIFLLPILISTLLSLFGLQGSCEFPNIKGL